jgi:hypothetical protein
MPDYALKLGRLLSVLYIGRKSSLVDAVIQRGFHHDGCGQTDNDKNQDIPGEDFTDHGQTI